MPPNKDSPPPTGPTQSPSSPGSTASSPSPPTGPIQPTPAASPIEKSGEPDAVSKIKATPADDRSLATKMPGETVLQKTTGKIVPVPPAVVEHYVTTQGGQYVGVEAVAHNVIITIANLRANGKMFLAMRDDQWALWSAGGSLRGVNITATKDPVLYLSSFLINAREMYLETYADSVEMQINLYVYTPQSNLRGRVDLPPGASVTLETRSDQTSVIGLSSFDIEL